MREIDKNKLIIGIAILAFSILASCSSNNYENVTSIATVSDTMIALTSTNTSLPKTTKAIRPTSTISSTQIQLTPTPSSVSTEIEEWEILEIAFVSDRDGNDEIYLMRSDGSNQINLSNHPASDDEPTWSTDGSKLAFISNRNDPNYEICSFRCLWNIYIYDFKNANMTLLTNINGDSPTWSPDGNRLAFRHLFETEDGHRYSDIYVINADGSNLQNLTNHESMNSSPIWNPNNNQILFQSNRNREDDFTFEFTMFVIDSDGSELTSLSDVFSTETDWSPDGQQIVFTSDKYSPATDIFIINTDGSNLQQLTFSPRYEASPQWSPNGEYIAYIFGCDWGMGCQIWLINSNSWSQEEIWTTREDISWLFWDSDSEKIFFIDEGDDVLDIYYIDIRKLQAKNLTQSDGNDYNPVFRP